MFYRPQVAVRFGTPVVTVPPPGAGNLRAAVNDRGIATVFEGETPMVLHDRTSAFGKRPVSANITEDGDLKRYVIQQETSAATIIKEVVSGPDDCWILWTVKSKGKKVKASAAATIDRSRLPAPYISYHTSNGQAVTERSQVSSAYALHTLLSGGKGNCREIQFGNSRHRVGAREDSKAKRLTMLAKVDTPANETTFAALRFASGHPDPYPELAWDNAREPRGIVASLLADIVPDRFVVVPTRSARYTLTGRPLTVRFKYHAADNVQRRVAVHCRVADMWEKVVVEHAFILANKGRRYARLDLPVICKSNGGYRMEITYTSGDVERTRELIWATIPEVPDTGIRPDSVFGAAIGGGDYTWTLADRIGLKWNRGHCAVGDPQIGNIQKERGQYNWGGMDNAVAMQDKYGILVCPTLNVGWKAKWAHELYKEDFEAYRDTYVNEYVRPLVERYKGRFRYYEVTNEPYFRYKHTPEKWVGLMKACYEAIKDIDPHATVVSTCGPATTHYGPSWYENTFAKGTLTFQDAVSCHLYAPGVAIGGGQALRVRRDVNTIRGLMKKHGGPVLPVINSEGSISLPPCTMHKHPSHWRFMKLGKGLKPLPPVVESQRYFKLLTMHKALGVKFSWHIFHGGIHLYRHTGDYDETPLSFLATQAALAKHLETAESVQDIPIHEEVYAGLFRKGDGWIVTLWCPKQMQNSCVHLQLPLASSHFRMVDVFDNPLPVRGTGARTDLFASWESYFLMVDGLTKPELLTAFEQAKVTPHIAEVTAGTIRGKLGGENPGRARPADWTGFVAIDLSKQANRGFTDDTAGDQKGGWTDEGENDMRYLPLGEWVINGVPFRILDSAKNGGNSCVVLKGGVDPNLPFPVRVSAPVNHRLSKVHFLHTAAWGGKNTPTCRYILHYRGGFTEELPIVCSKNINNWWSRSDPPDAKMAWSGPGGMAAQVRVWHFTHTTNHPNGAQAWLDRIELLSEKGKPVPVIISITGSLAN